LTASWARTSQVCAGLMNASFFACSQMASMIAWFW
jgi:hypothetical protein